MEIHICVSILALNSIRVCAVAPSFGNKTLFERLNQCCASMSMVCLSVAIDSRCSEQTTTPSDCGQLSLFNSPPNKLGLDCQFQGARIWPRSPCHADHGIVHGNSAMMVSIKMKSRESSLRIVTSLCGERYILYTKNRPCGFLGYFNWSVLYQTLDQSPSGKIKKIATWHDTKSTCFRCQQ